MRTNDWILRAARSSPGSLIRILVDEERAGEGEGGIGDGVDLGEGVGRIRGDS